jgi:MFS family permease
VVASLVGAEGEQVGSWLSGVFNRPVANWQVAYIIGGAMGFALLLLRVGTLESAFFKNVEHESSIRKGDLKLIFTKKANLVKYVHCILIGIPIWYIIGLIVMNSADNFGPWLGVENVVNGKAVMYAYLGLSFGDLISGILSQLLKSRKKVVQLYVVFTLCLTLVFLFGLKNVSLETYYFMCFLLGTGTGYWAIFVTIAAEQFGTNIRSTAANTIPNFVRGSVNLVTLLFGLLLSLGCADGISALIVGVGCMAMALWSISQLTETFGKDLDYNEVHETL